MRATLSFLMRQPLKSMWTRGPKKAKQEVTAQSDDLINIFKERSDPEIKDIDEYPLWLLELALPLDHPLEAIPSFQTNDKPFQPPVSHFRSILRAIHREKILAMNEYKQQTADTDEIQNDDTWDDSNIMEMIRAEKYAAEQAAQQAAQDAEADEDDDAPKAKKPVVQKEVDDDTDAKTPAKGAAAPAKGAGGAAKPAAGGAAKKTK